MTRACVLLAPGFEEIEAVTVIDVLRRADVDTSMVGVAELEVEGAHGIAVAAEVLLADVADEPYDLVVLPGGMPGAAHLRDSDAVQRFLKARAGEGARMAAICAAPIALAKAGLLEGKRATSYPSFREQVTGAVYSEDPVVVDGLVVTSRGPGTALRFALQIVELVCGEDKAAALAEQMLTSH